MKLLGIVLLVIVGLFMGAYLIQLTINNTFSLQFLTTVFGGKVSYWQAFGVTILLGAIGESKS